VHFSFLSSRLFRRFFYCSFRGIFVGSVFPGTLFYGLTFPLSPPLLSSHMRQVVDPSSSRLTYPARALGIVHPPPRPILIAHTSSFFLLRFGSLTFFFYHPSTLSVVRPLFELILSFDLLCMPFYFAFHRRLLLPLALPAPPTFSIFLSRTQPFYLTCVLWGELSSFVPPLPRVPCADFSPKHQRSYFPITLEYGVPDGVPNLLVSGRSLALGFDLPPFFNR